MPRFETTTNDTLRPVYREICDAGFGAGEKPINWFGALGHNPSVLKIAWNLVRGMLVESSALPPTLKQMILMTISLQNNCRYCSVTHTGVLEAMGVPEEVIVGCARDPSTARIPPPHRQLIAFALKAAQDPNSVHDDDIEALRDIGLADREISEAAMLSGFAQFINTWADVSGIDVDVPSKTKTWEMFGEAQL